MYFLENDIIIQHNKFSIYEIRSSSNTASLAFMRLEREDNKKIELSIDKVPNIITI